ncbi:MAG TPA: hypothetical protein PLL33_09775, partial [Paracoccus sp. (in: a-proteobacteria)]|nr:hypothetical protein [Paracoccus sp. (in: a-proteobacteria)]
MGPITSFSDVVSMIRRHAAVIAAVISAGILGTLLHVMSIPATYEASAVVQLRNSAVSVGGETMLPARRLQLIEQRLMSRGNILKLIDRHDLFSDAEGMSVDQKVAAFRMSTQIQMINAAGVAPREGESTAVTALIVTSRAGDPQDAADLVNDLTASLIDQDRQERLSSIEAAQRFLRSEQQRLNIHILQIDDEIGRVKRENEESLPVAVEPIRSEQAQLRGMLMDLEQRELQLAREKLALERQAQSPDPEAREATLAARLSKLTSELAQSRRVLPANHPEIARIEQEIEKLRQNPAELETATGVEREIALVEQQREAIAQQRKIIRDRQAEIAAALETAPL